MAGDLTIVTMVFDTSSPERLIAVLSNYVVRCRGEAGCRNVDLCASATTPGRFVVIQKWESADAQRAHFDSPVMVEMAKAASPVLEGPPAIDLLDGLSAHDLA
jgi:quinol monooxygenase YgiN